MEGEGKKKGCGEDKRKNCMGSADSKNIQSREDAVIDTHMALMWQ